MHRRLRSIGWLPGFAVILWWTVTSDLTSVNGDDSRQEMLVRDLIDQNINPLQEACEHAHRLGIEFDAQLRMAILGRTPMDYNVELPGQWEVLSRMGHDHDMQVFSERQPSGILGVERLIKVGGAEVVKLANEEAGYPQKFLFLFSGGVTPAGEHPVKTDWHRLFAGRTIPV